MQSRLTFLRNLHHFLSRNLFYPLALSTLLTLAIWQARTWRSPDWNYHFIPWNLFLAWIPYAFSLVVVLLHKRFPGQWWLLVIPFVFWLIFFPNAPYTITDLLHLDERPPVPFWYDVGLLATFAWSGCFLAVVSLNIMQHVVKSYWGNLASWLFVASSIMLSGLGIYLGRFLQLNSWDLFIKPQRIFMDIAVRVLHPIRYQQTYGVTLMFASLLLVCYLTFVSVRQRERH